MKLNITIVNRVGLILDVARVLAEHGLMITSMEADASSIFIETDPLPADAERRVVDAIRRIPQAIDIAPVESMPHEIRSEHLKGVMGAISDGIIAVDQEGRVTHFNAAAEKIARVSASEMVGELIVNLFGPDVPILETLKTGEIYSNREIFLPRSKARYFSSGRPIYDQRGRIIGAVAVLKDLTDVRALVHTVTHQLPITFDQILFRSSAMQRIVNLAKAIAPGDSTVLIRGETGTGKEVFARALHAASPRADKAFVPINCSAIPDTLLESELFGYEKGAFTGAIKAGKQGLFEFADGGSIFLDEIGELAPHLQAKLLRILQDGSVRRIGGMQEIFVNVRILAATNRKLEDFIKEGWFREDLYYRLNVIPLFLPPLRTRKEDIPLLTQVLLKRYAARLQKPEPALSGLALQKLMHYQWPGNIRELENVIERTINIMTGPIVYPENIILDQAVLQETEAPFEGDMRSLKNVLAQTERAALAKVMEKNPTSRKLGAALGLSHTAVLKKLRKHGLRFPKLKERINSEADEGGKNVTPES